MEIFRQANTKNDYYQAAVSVGLANYHLSKRQFAEIDSIESQLRELYQANDAGFQFDLRHWALFNTIKFTAQLMQAFSQEITEGEGPDHLTKAVQAFTEAATSAWRYNNYLSNRVQATLMEDLERARALDQATFHMLCSNIAAQVERQVEQDSNLSNDPNMISLANKLKAQITISLRDSMVPYDLTTT